MIFLDRYTVCRFILFRTKSLFRFMQNPISQPLANRSFRNRINTHIETLLNKPYHFILYRLCICMYIYIYRYSLLIIWVHKTQLSFEFIYLFNSMTFNVYLFNDIKAICLDIFKVHILAYPSSFNNISLYLIIALVHCRLPYPYRNMSYIYGAVHTLYIIIIERIYCLHIYFLMLYTTIYMSPSNYT